ncbi:hypothetical protein AAKU67_000532 [Oxalobacteraceae bacterium GrIS 2.11]
MTRLLIPDSGPLFSLAVANELGLLSKFRIGISDIVRDETINRGLLPSPTVEAKRLLEYYNRNAANIETFQTQVGIRIAAEKRLNPNYKVPANLGELSIQSMLIDLQLSRPGSNPVVLFEDGWFLQHTTSLAKPCLLLSTEAFLEYAEEMQWIPSAAQARAAIAMARPGAYQKK